MIIWRKALRAAFAPAPAEPAQYAAILFSGYVGRRGFSLTRLNVGDQYGMIGSRGVTWQLNTWRDPS